jgi:hypothetical protein
MPDFEKLLMFGVKNPGRNARDQRILGLRQKIEEELEAARLRIASVGALLEIGNAADAAPLAGSMADNLVRAASLLHGQSDPAALPDPELREALAALPDAQGKTPFARRDIASALERGRRCLEMLSRDAATAFDGPLAVSEDRYEKRRRRRLHLLLAVVFILIAGTILSWDYVAEKRREQAVEFLEMRKEAETREVLQELAELAYQAKKRSGLPLAAVTGDVCTRCGCADTNLQSLDGGDKCLKKWLAAALAISRANGRETLPARFEKDAWGAPFLLNENEKEQPGECVKDTISSAGRDGRMGTADDLTAHIDNHFCKN